MVTRNHGLDVLVRWASHYDRKQRTEQRKQCVYVNWTHSRDFIVAGLARTDGTFMLHGCCKCVFVLRGNVLVSLVVTWEQHSFELEGNLTSVLPQHGTRLHGKRTVDGDQSCPTISAIRRWDAVQPSQARHNPRKAWSRRQPSTPQPACPNKLPQDSLLNETTNCHLEHPELCSVGLIRKHKRRRRQLRRRYHAVSFTGWYQWTNARRQRESETH